MSVMMENKQILGYNMQIQHPTVGSQEFNALQIEWWGPLNMPLLKRYWSIISPNICVVHVFHLYQLYIFSLEFGHK